MKYFIISLLSVLSFSSSAQQSDSPKLVVGIVVDQMCYEYLYRYYNKFGKDGIRLLMDKGTNCRNTNFNYIPTYTGPGHASIYTGTTPTNHGIVGNDWYDRSFGAQVNCVGDSTVFSIGTQTTNGECSPFNLKVNTITDQLKLTYPKSKVISMSIKNRGAILPGGHLSDGSYWYDYSSGKFITSSFFMDSLPDWVKSFNNGDCLNKYSNMTWNTLYDINTYSESEADDSPYEHLLPGKKTPTFPYSLKEMTVSEDVSFADIFPYTPFANTYLKDFAMASIDAEGLGKDDQTDMLCISFSSTDIIGHAFGPYSVEIEDTYLRFDKDIAALITALDEKVGKDEYVIFFTADHAVVPVPQYLTDKNLPGGYFFVDTNMVDLSLALTEKYGEDLVLNQINLNVYLDNERIKALNLNKEEVENFTANVIAEWSGVKHVYTSAQLENSNVSDEWKDMVRNGYHAAESGNVLFILDPGYLPKSSDYDGARKGTSHGSAYSYDTQVPLIWYGKNVPQQEIFRHINITDITATLTHLLYLQKPNATTGNPILELLGL